jgi:cysteine-rich repeat protein
VEGKEECDDGNLLEGDGCSSACLYAAITLPHCGDGQIQSPEQCDAGNRNSNSEPGACRTNCMVAYCGDGVKEGAEACDDGNADDRDGCTWKCEVSVCGNKNIEAMEECDLGKDNSDEKPNVCRTVCRKPWCGDGVIDAGEECDDANGIETDGCLKSCELSCPAGSNKIQGRCIAFQDQEAACGIFCEAGGAWNSFVDWLFGFFE